MTRVSQTIDRIDATFDDPNLIANAGLLVVATLTQCLGLEALINATVRLAGRVGGTRPGRKVLTLVHAIIAGASHIDHVDVLRSGSTERVLGHRVMAPSTIGTFLRSFTFGHVRQLEAVVGRALERAWKLGAGPGKAPLVIDVDSTICEVAGNAKHGAGYGYTKVLGYHPILATRADTGEVLHARMRKGQANTQRGARRFIDEVVARLRRAGATGELTMRFDAGFWSNETIKTLNRHGVRYTMAVRAGHTAIATAIASIDETAWRTIDYTPGGQAQVAECDYSTGTGSRRVTRRLIVRRTRLIETAQQRLFPVWRHHAFLTDLDADAVTVDAFHRQHAVVELAIRDLKEGAGLEHVPSGNFHANSAWLQTAVLAHNLIRWTAHFGKVRVDDQLVVARTIRTRLVAIPPGSSTEPGAPSCGSRPDGHGPTRSPPRSTRCDCCGPLPPDEPHRGQARRSTPTSADNPSNTKPASTRPDTRQRAAHHPNPAHRTGNHEPVNPIGGLRLRCRSRRCRRGIGSRSGCGRKNPRCLGRGLRKRRSRTGTDRRTRRRSVRRRCPGSATGRFGRCVGSSTSDSPPGTPGPPRVRRRHPRPRR